MAEIRPFRGYRYQLSKPEDLGNLIAPPYDMLDDAGIDVLYKKDPLNAVRVDQNRREAGDAANRDRHSRAAQLFTGWVEGGKVRADGKPSFYIYEQRFSIDRGGVTEQFIRSGVVALVKLVDFSEGVVFPHEYTLSGPKIDRYEHLEATRLNVGQIFGLVSDEKGEIFKLIQSMKNAAGTPAGTAADRDGVQHALYCCSDASLISRLQKAVQPATILIADGHHRYETALKYFHDHGNGPDCSSVMMTLVSMADPGLIIRSFHRLIRKGTADRVKDMRRELEGNFSLTDLGSADCAIINAFLGGRIKTGMLFVDSASHRIYGLKLNDESRRFLASTLPDRSLSWKHLAMSIINSIVINRILGLPLDGQVLHDRIAYMNDVPSALEASSNTAEYWGGFFIRPVSIREIHAIVHGGERMPQKSTNFYPKLYSGLVFNRLDKS